MNENIQAARDAALDLLKPSKSDLEHGLELHQRSVVCDAYGFAPRSAVDGEVMAKAVEEAASALEIQDLHEDMAMTRCVTDPAERQEVEGAWEASGVTCILQNAGEEGQAVPRLIKRLARFTYLTDLMPEFITKAVTPDDIESAKEAGRHCLYLTGNGVPLPQDWVSVPGELRYIRVFFQLGSRMMHLTYNRRNMIGDGCAEPANAGLSDFGRAVVAEMNRVGVIVDVAHAGWQTSLEAAKASVRPMVASHSGCVSVNEHIRCKPDEVIRAIADTGGYVGICWIPAFLGRSGGIAAVLDHIDYIVKTFGVDHVAIGTDTAYTSRNAETENAKFLGRPRTRPRWASFWPENDPLFNRDWPSAQQRLSLAWTNWPMFTVGLVQRGYTDEDVQKIVGGNVLRVARAVFAASHPSRSA